MARTRTLTLLRDDVRFLADVQDQTSRHTDADVTRLINQAIAEYRRRFAAHFLTTATTDTVAQTATVSLPSDLDHLERLELDAGNNVKYVVGHYQSWEAQDYATSSYDQDSLPTSYRIEGSTLTLTPTPDAAYTLTFVYLPQQTDLSGDSDTFDPVIAGGEQWVTYWAAKQICIRDLSPSVQARYQVLAAELQRCEQQLLTSQRNPGPGRRVDTRGRRRLLEIDSRNKWWRY